MIDDDDAAFVEDEKARIAELHKNAPEIIWLQIDPEAEQFDGWDGLTWCADRINETDLKYVRADIVKLTTFQGISKIPDFEESMEKFHKLKL